MEQITNFVKPELLILIPVLYFIGIGLKKSQSVKDNYIPLILGLCGVLLAVLYVLVSADITTLQGVLLAAFTGITQGVLCAGCSVYVNQLVKQGGKKDE